MLTLIKNFFTSNQNKNYIAIEFFENQYLCATFEKHISIKKFTGFSYLTFEQVQKKTASCSTELLLALSDDQLIIKTYFLPATLKNHEVYNAIYRQEKTQTHLSFDWEKIKPSQDTDEQIIKAYFLPLLTWQSIQNQYKKLSPHISILMPKSFLGTRDLTLDWQQEALQDFIKSAYFALAPTAEVLLKLLNHDAIHHTKRYA